MAREKDVKAHPEKYGATLTNAPRAYLLWVAKLARPFCASCYRIRSEADLLVINTPGGFGKAELLLCRPCLNLPKWKGAREYFGRPVGDV